METVNDTKAVPYLGRTKTVKKNVLFFFYFLSFFFFLDEFHLPFQQILNLCKILQGHIAQCETCNQPEKSDRKLAHLVSPNAFLYSNLSVYSLNQRKFEFLTLTVGSRKKHKGT